MSQMICDGCGRRGVSAEHIAARIARLEWTTRYRPLHMQALFVAEAPGALLANDFYAPGAGAEGRRRDYGTLLDALGITVAITPAQAATNNEPGDENVDSQLAEFQRRGFFLTYLVECPLEGVGGEHTLKPGSAEVTECFAPGLARRIRISYRPRQVVVLAPVSPALVAALEAAALGATVTLDKNGPVEVAQVAKHLTEAGQR